MDPLNTYGDYIHRTAKEHGWWENPARNKLVDALVSDFGLDRDAVRLLVEHHWPTRSVAEMLLLIISEVVEAFEEYRAGNFDEIYNETGKPEGGPIELADAIIRILDMAAARGWDMDSAISTKMKYNDKRPYRHGGKLA